MKPALLVFFFLMMMFRCAAQEVNTMPAAATQTDTARSQKPQSIKGYHLVKKPEYHVSVGMDFFSASGYGSGLTQYVAPSISYPIGKRFVLSGGLVVANTNYFNARPLFSGDAFQPYSGNYTSLTVYASGTYFLNDRLTISGAFYKEIPVAGRSVAYAPYGNSTMQGSQGFKVNAQYRLGEHVFIQAGFEMNQGRDPYNINPYAPARHHGFDDLNWGFLPQTIYNVFTPQP